MLASSFFQEVYTRGTPPHSQSTLEYSTLATDSPPTGPQALREALIELVTHELADGARLPSERELATTYGVNRLTVRRAIDALVTEGLVRRRQGAGSFVSRASRSRSLITSSFTGEARARGLQPGNAQVSISTVSADARMSTFLEVPPGTELRTIMRLRTIARAPIAIDQTWIRRDLVEDLTSLDRDASLLQTLLSRYELPIDQIDETVSASVLDRRSAQMLRTLAMMPALLVAKTMRSHDGTPIAYCETLLRGDRYKYHNTITRKGN